MNFSTGQIVIHPHHGPAKIKKIANRTLRDTRRMYLRLEVKGSDLTVAVPADQADELGIRPVLTDADAREVLTVLLEPSEKEETVWSRRIKHDTSRLRSGEIRIIAELVRDLLRRNEVKRLSFGEMSLLREAMGPFVAEIAIVLSMTEDEVTAMVEAAVLEGTAPTMPKAALAPTG